MSIPLGGGYMTYVQGCLSRGPEPTLCTAHNERMPAWTRWDHMERALPKFVEVMKDLPPAFKHSTVSSTNHRFALWYMVYSLQPPVIVESGVFQGEGTWFLRQAAPAARIICVDPSPITTLQYKDPNATYLMGRACLLYTSPSPRDRQKSRMPSSA